MLSFFTAYRSFGRFWQARHPPRYATFLTPPSPRFGHSSKEDALGDLLCDLMHWATANSFDFNAALCRASGHHKAELDEELPDTISIEWSTDDVQEVRPDLTKDQCRQVLAVAKDRHDATLGVNWDMLSIIADDLFPEP